MNDDNSNLPSVEQFNNSSLKISGDDRNLATLAHLLGIFTSFIGPAIIWIISKNRQAPFVIENAREAMNFQVTMAVCYALASVLNFVILGFLFFPILFIFNIVVSITAISNTRNGITYVYPFSFKLFQ